MIRESSVRVAVVGIGLIGPRHAKSVAECSDAELLCFVDPSPGAQGIADSFNVPLFDSVKRMLHEGCNPDAAIVCTPNNTHASIAKELLTSGVHVLVEKPIAITVEDGRDLIRTAQSSGKQLLVGHHRRFNPYVTTTKRVLEDGVIGRPIAVSGLWALFKPLSYFVAPTEWRAKSDGGGVVMINLIHEVDILQFLFGPIIRVHAEQTTSVRGHEVEEGAAILMRFESGLVGTFVIVDASPSAHNFESSTGENPTIPKAGKDIYRIFGADGTLSVGDMVITRHSTTKSWTSELKEVQIPVDLKPPFDEQILNLVRVVRGKESPRCSGGDGFSAVLVCDCIKQAMSRGEAVDVEDESEL